MGFFAKVKDVFLDQFGVFDDIDDFAVFVRNQQIKVDGKIRALRRVIEHVKQEVRSVETVAHVNFEEIRRTKALVDDLLDEIEQVRKDYENLIRKARRDKDIWQFAAGPLEDGKREIDKFHAEAKEAAAEFKIDIDTLIEHLRELAQEIDERKYGTGLRKVSVIAAKMLGATAAFAAFFAVAPVSLPAVVSVLTAGSTIYVMERLRGG